MPLVFKNVLERTDNGVLAHQNMVCRLGAYKHCLVQLYGLRTNNLTFFVALPVCP